MSATTRSRLDDLIAEDAGAGEESAGGGGMFFTELKADPGALGLDSLLAEVNKLQRVRGLQLPPELSGTCRRSWWRPGGRGRRRSAPRTWRAAAGPVRYTLLSTLCHVRETKITDSLVELFRSPRPSPAGRTTHCSPPWPDYSPAPCANTGSSHRAPCWPGTSVW
ncbi:hypothetical protein [Streptomyces antimycoticus]|uniref:hypothetical protein n=1 Tax=Streptomyces antimycoticus TaxID=68175 RepID=UPI0033CCB952